MVKIGSEIRLYSKEDIYDLVLDFCLLYTCISGI